MGFVQIIDMRTSRFDELQALGAEWEAAAGGESRAQRRVLCQDRNDPGRYLNIVFFDSYEDAMANSAHPTTQEFSSKMAALVDGAPTFIDLDVVEDVTG
jgi:quinol monooxygenase YgiN